MAMEWTTPGNHMPNTQRRTFWLHVAKKILQGTVKVKVDRRRGGKTILRTEQRWTLLAQLGQLKTCLRRIVVKSYVVPQRPRKVLG